MSHDGIGPRAVLRSVAFLTAGMLTLPALAGCGSEDPAGEPSRARTSPARTGPTSPTAGRCAGPWTPSRTP